MRSSYEIIIIGAGAAGIACAERLHASGHDFLLIEARDRVGGRVLSRVDDLCSVPIELGAEFIHGAPASTLNWMSRLHLPFYDVKDEHLVLKNGELQKVPDYWNELEEVNKKLNPQLRKDRSVQKFLTSHPSLKPSAVALFRSYVEGFQAADLDIMGERELVAAEEDPSEELNGSSLFRCARPYSHLLEGIFRSFATEENYCLQTTVGRIRWQPGHVTLDCVTGPEQSARQFTSSRLVVSLPVGVLQSGAVRWDPFPGALAHFLEGVHMGHIQRLVFRFRERFWEELSDEPYSFLHANPDHNFPTWWTFSPLRSPHLVAWQGGPKAHEFSRRGEAERVHLALETLSALTKKSVPALEAQLEQVSTHDWTHDPYSRGAYSYLGIDGLHRDRACWLMEDTIAMAGEAFATGSHIGTVHGALESGARAAQRIAKSARS